MRSIRFAFIIFVDLSSRPLAVAPASAATRHKHQAAPVQGESVDGESC